MEERKAAAEALEREKAREALELELMGREDCDVKDQEL